MQKRQRHCVVDAGHRVRGRDGATARCHTVIELNDRCAIHRCRIRGPCVRRFPSVAKERFQESLTGNYLKLLPTMATVAPIGQCNGLAPRFARP